MSSIAGTVSELAEINKELKRQRQKVKELNLRKKELENTILSFLRETNQPGVKYRGLRIEKADKITHARVKKTEKLQAWESVLRNNGVTNVDDVVDELLEAMTGPEKTEPKLTIKPLGK